VRTTAASCCSRACRGPLHLHLHLHLPHRACPQVQHPQTLSYLPLLLTYIRGNRLMRLWDMHALVDRGHHDLLTWLCSHLRTQGHQLSRGELIAPGDKLLKCGPRLLTRSRMGLVLLPRQHHCAEKLL